jgi:hypothetical protein
MTEFEMAYLLTDMQAAAATNFGVVISVTSGFLVTGYVIGHRLNWSMIAIIMTLYSLYMFASANILARLQVSIFGLVEKMAAESADGKTLTWHAAHSMPPTKFLVDNIGTGSLIFGFAIWAGAIAFFFIARRMNLKREQAEATAKTATAAPLAPPAATPAP